MAEYVSSHSKLPAALTLEYERVLSPCLLDGHNRYAGAEYVSGTEPQPSLLQKGLFERGQCKYVQASCSKKVSSTLCLSVGSGGLIAEACTVLAV